jgi:hypothetical protein
MSLARKHVLARHPGPGRFGTVMEFDKRDIQDFKKMCEEELGLELSDTEAAEEAQRLINLMKAIISS